MIKRFLGVTGALVLLCLVLLGLRYSHSRAGADPPPVMANPRPLIGASTKEIEAYAVEWAKEELHVTGEPVVVLSRAVKLGELAELGLTQVGGDAERECMVVVLKGDFDLHCTFPGTCRDPEGWHSRVGYVAYVFDVNVGEPALLQTSLYGGEFRTLLNDPTLPLAEPPG